LKRTGRVVSLYSVFNAQALIRNSMTSALPITDEFLVYDGKYTGFKCPCKREHDNSCDNTLKEVERFASETGAKVTIVQTKDMPEFDKRNLMFDAVSEGDCALIIDDDEIIYGYMENVRKFARDETAKLQFNVPMLRWRHSFTPLPRFFIKREGLRYVQMVRGSYSYEFADSRGMIPLEDFETLPNVRLVNLYGTYNEVGYRERERDGARSNYNELGINNKLPQGKTCNPP
jgi:hypothetical protein